MLYDAVVYSVGAQTDRRLGIPGEDLPGSWAATEFVAWYNGHPDFQDLEFDLSHERAVVIGNGNVALDVARMLALTPDELAPTDTTEEAIAAINGCRRPRDPRRRPARAGAGCMDSGRGRRARRAGGRRHRRRSGRSRARRCKRRRARGVAADGQAQRRAPARLRSAHACREAAPHPAALLRLPGRDSRLRQGRGDRARPQRAGRRTGGLDGRPRDDPLRDRLSQRRLPRRRPTGCPVRRRLRDDPERGRPGRAGPVCGRLDQARPERRDRDEQEGRDGDDRVAARGREGGELPQRGGGTLEDLLGGRGTDAVMYAGWQAIDEAERSAGEPQGRPRIKLHSWDALLDAARRS